ncbi:MAG TPA: RIO1 family regulatory kinase/ATPase [Abditibacterium sp.]|jgi:predicted Ser/Thr protein kinase
MNVSDFDDAAFQSFWRSSQSESLHTARNWSKADVSRLEWPSASRNWVVIKDMSGRPLWFRLTAGRYYLKREFRALKALEGVEGVPRALSLLTPDILVMEWKAGTPASKLREKGEFSTESLQKLSALLAEIHARGVTHGDLHRDNVLVEENGAVALIDWATASVFKKQNSMALNPLKMWTRREWMALDRRAVAKLKARHAPEMLDATENDLLLNGSSLSQAIRKTGYFLRRLAGKNAPSSPAEARRRLERDLAKAAKNK